MTRLFVSDLDGTLLDPSAALSTRSRAELAALLQAGMRFTVASARSVATIAAILDGLPLALPVIELNGGLITDLRTRRSLICHGLDPVIAELATASYLEDRMQAHDPRLQPPGDCLATLDQTILCITLIARRAVVLPIAAQIEAAFPGATNTLCYENRYSPGWEWLTVQSAHATKDRALREVAELCGLGLPDVTVFGDEINDLPMFRAAGRGVAVENAIAELKAIAHEVIGPHHEDSVVRYLRRSHA